MIQPALINLHPNEYHQKIRYYSFAANLDRSAGSCNILDDLSSRVCVYLGFVITYSFLKNPQPGNDMAFHRVFPFYGNLYIHKHWEFHGFSKFLNSKSAR